MELHDDLLIREMQERVPLFRKPWLETLRRMRAHKEAPYWNTLCGDRLQAEDLAFVQSFARALQTERCPGSNRPGGQILAWLETMRRASWWFEDKLRGLEPERDFHLIPLMQRADLQLRLEQIVPHSLSLSGMVVNPTSGTTGQPIPCPNHPSAVGCYDPLILFSLRQHGAKLKPDYRFIAALQLCAQQETITYNTVHAGLEGAGFAKINLASHQWPAADSVVRYIRDMAPLFLSGDPFAFFTALRLGVDYHPGALLSTALTLPAGLRTKLAAHFGCPVVNFYSLNETGPLAYSCPADPQTLHLLPTDIYLETVDADGLPCSGEGELTVTGGRNPFLPLLRYLTGDRGVLDYTPCPCGDPQPRIRGLQARQNVFFHTPAGGIVNPVDISRLLKDYPLVMFQLIQEEDYACRLRLFPQFPIHDSMQAQIITGLRQLFGRELELSLSCDLSPSEGKILPYICRLGEDKKGNGFF